MFWNFYKQKVQIDGLVGTAVWFRRLFTVDVIRGQLLNIVKDWGALLSV